MMMIMIDDEDDGDVDYDMDDNDDNLDMIQMIMKLTMKRLHNIVILKANHLVLFNQSKSWLQSNRYQTYWQWKHTDQFWNSSSPER